MKRIPLERKVSHALKMSNQLHLRYTYLVTKRIHQWSDLPKLHNFCSFSHWIDIRFPLRVKKWWLVRHVEMKIITASLDSGILSVSSALAGLTEQQMRFKKLLETIKAYRVARTPKRVHLWEEICYGNVGESDNSFPLQGYLNPNA